MYIDKSKFNQSTMAVQNMYTAEDAKHVLDFETNYKSQAKRISEIVIAETTFITSYDFDVFKTLIVTPITWADVKYIDDGFSYELFLTT